MARLRGDDDACHHVGERPKLEEREARIRAEREAEEKLKAEKEREASEAVAEAEEHRGERSANLKRN